jgi:hypothetical protein
VSGRRWLFRRQVGRCVPGRDGDINPMGGAAQSQLAAVGERLQAEAATARCGGAGGDGAVGRKRPCRAWTVDQAAGGDQAADA